MYNVVIAHETGTRNVSVLFERFVIIIIVIIAGKTSGDTEKKGNIRTAFLFSLFQSLFFGEHVQLYKITRADVSRGGGYGGICRY